MEEHRERDYFFPSSFLICHLGGENIVLAFKNSSGEIDTFKNACIEINIKCAIIF